MRVCLSLRSPLFAHHSFGAEYDGTKPVTLTGVITMVQWTNPHFYFFMDVKDTNGEVANWKFEGYPPTVLNRIGWKKNETMLPGDTVTAIRLARPGRLELGPLQTRDVREERQETGGRSSCRKW